MLDQELAFAPAIYLRQLILEKQISPVELTELYLSRIDQLDGQLNSYLTVTHDLALDGARAAEAAVVRGEDLGPLTGIPTAIKDLELTKGIRTTSGSLIFKNRVPDEDSVAAERVRQAGAVILGKTNTPEFGLRGTTENRLGGACRNPWDPTRTAGGSSGGAGAALAAGLCALATGSDAGGSIRIPASFCGTYGIKPTQGRIPRYLGAGAIPVANQVAQPGPMGRTVADTALLLQVMAGFDRRDPTCLRTPPPNFLAAAKREVRGLRIGWSPDFGYAAVDPQVVHICESAAQRFTELGCTVEDAGLKVEPPLKAFWTIFTVNYSAANARLLDSYAELLTDYARETLLQGAAIPAADYALALGQVDRLKATFEDYFEQFDLLLSPTMAVTAFPVGEKPERIAGVPVDPDWGYTPFTYTINLIGHTAASIPCGLSNEGLPAGLHIVGRRGDEEMVLAASAAFERLGLWVDPRPVVS